MVPITETMDHTTAGKTAFSTVATISMKAEVSEAGATAAITEGTTATGRALGTEEALTAATRAEADPISWEDFKEEAVPTEADMGAAVGAVNNVIGGFDEYPGAAQRDGGLIERRLVHWH
jgi:hypothetical protein